MWKEMMNNVCNVVRCFFIYLFLFLRKQQWHRCLPTHFKLLDGFNCESKDEDSGGEKVGAFPSLHHFEVKGHVLEHRDGD
jgi:hypothetical protein